MNKSSLDKEKDALDFITSSMFSLGFLKNISDIIFSPNKYKVTVGQFYDQWIKNCGAQNIKIPFSLGAILGDLYCGILFAKENWIDLLPDVDFRSVDPKWGISGLTFTASKVTNPNLKYLVKRIRNALGHGNIEVNVPKGIEKNEITAKVTIDFHDENMRDSSDTFDMTCSLDQLSTFVKEFQSIIHSHVRSKK